LNIPGLDPGDRPHVYHIYTSSKDREQIEQHPAFLRLKSFVATEFEIIDEQIDLFGQRRVNQYDIMGFGYAKSAQAATMDGGVVIPLWADGIFSNGSFQRLQALARQGKKSVGIFGHQADHGTFVPELKDLCFDPATQAITVSASELNRLYLKHISPNWEAFFVDSGRFPDQDPSFFAWRVGDEGVLTRAMVLHPFLATPLANGSFPPTLGTGTDATHYFTAISPDFERDVHIVEDTDEICFVSLDARPLVHPANPHPSPMRMANAIKRRSWPHTRKLLAAKIRFHVGARSPLWDEVERQSDQFLQVLFDQVDLFDKHPDLFNDSLRLGIPRRHAYVDKFTEEWLCPRVNNLVHGWNSRKKKVLIYGAGFHTNCLGSWTDILHADLVGIADGNPGLYGKNIMGFNVIAPNQIESSGADVVLISSANFQDEIYERLEGIEAKGIELVRLYY
jgi:hypothetical protein